VFGERRGGEVRDDARCRGDGSGDGCRVAGDGNGDSDPGDGGRTGHRNDGPGVPRGAELARSGCHRRRRPCHCGREARGEGRHQEGRRAQGRSRGGGELWGRDVLRGHEKENPVSLRGVGLGLRWEFIDELVAASAVRELPIDFLEISPENYIGRGGRYPAALGRLAERYPIVTHGLTMSLGGVDPLDDVYLRDLATFVREMDSPWHSDHLCFGAVGGRALHDLLPLSLKRSTVDRVAERVRRARDVIDRPIAIENVSYYWHPGRAEMGEAELLASVCAAADCALLLDVNNAYVNATNFGFDIDAWLSEAPLDRVVQIHVAGHEWFTVDDRGIGEPASPHRSGAMVIDTHGADVQAPVMALLERVLARTGPVPVVLERDQNVPALDELFGELERIRAIWERCGAEDLATAPRQPAAR
jgi:uncharacterized protein